MKKQKTITPSERWYETLLMEEIECIMGSSITVFPLTDNQIDYLYRYYKDVFGKE